MPLLDFERGYVTQKVLHHNESKSVCIYLANSAKHNAPVAIKAVLKHSDEDSLVRVEQRILKSIRGMDGMVQIVDDFETETHLCIVMEYAPTDLVDEIGRSFGVESF